MVWAEVAEQNDVNPIINRQKGDISSVPPNGIKPGYSNVTGISTNGMDKSAGMWY